MQVDFPGWIQAQLDENGWTQADLLQRARARGYKIDPAQLSRTLSREQEAGIDTVVAIAHGFDLPREYVFRKRGWLLPSTEETIQEVVASINEAGLDPRLIRFVEAVGALPPSTRDPVLTAAMAILDALKEASGERAAPPGIPIWITVEDAAQRSGYSVRTIQRLAQEGKIETWQPGHELFTTLESVLTYRERAKMGRPQKNS